MGALQSHDQTQAGVIFQMLREGVATEDIARRITTGLALMDMRLTTETKLRFEFPYRAQMPLEILSSNVPYLQSPIYELYKTPEKMAVWDQNKPQYMKPYRAADMADSRLKSPSLRDFHGAEPRDAEHFMHIKAYQDASFTGVHCLEPLQLDDQYHFMKAPIIESPPKFPLPDPLEEASWYGEIMLLYPPNNQFCPMHFRHLQRARSELSLILLEITTTLWGDSIELRDQYLYNFIDEKSKQLDEWAKSLPAALAPVEIVYPSHFKLHLLFFNVIMNLQGLVEAKVDETPTSQVYVNRSRRVANHARLCFETLMRLYYLRHGYEMSDTYITHALATLGFATLNQLMQPSADGMVATERTDEIRSTVFLMAKGLADQGRNYFIPYTIFELIKHSLTADDTRTLQRFLSPPISFGETASGRLRADHIQAQYPVNIVDMTRHPEQKRLGNMIRDFSALAVELQSPQAAEGANTVQSESS
ncbi:hypothetical protein ACQRIT_007815 [Beauveria bassiana]